MKKNLALLLLSGLPGIGLAAVPSVTSFSAASLLSGEVLTLSASVTDSDNNLAQVRFYLAGPGLSGWISLGTATASGGAVTKTQTWTATNPGLYTARVEVSDAAGSVAAQEVTFDVFAERRTLAGFNVPAGKGLFFSARGELNTATDTAGISTSAAPTSNLVLWSTGRIVLKPGFRVEQGANFWAAIDHNENSYSDLEEATDTDGDGMFDAWEVDHGLNPISAADRNTDLDGDGRSNFTEFTMGGDPRNNADGPSLPGGVDLVLVVGSSRYGVAVSNWKIQGI